MGQSAVSSLTLLTALLIVCDAPRALAQDWSRVPGVPIAYLEAPSRVPLLGYPYPWDEDYIGSPSITILDDGTYIATHDVFGLGTSENTTWVYRSTNKGASWTQLGSVNNFWSTAFSIGNTVYLAGPREGGDNGDYIIRKSTDKGNTWTSSVILDGDYGGTPNSPVFYDGRIWLASGTANAMSAPVNSDLMNPANWTRSNSESETAGQNYFGSAWQGWSEGQIVASPEMGVYIMPKVRALPYAGLVKVTSPTNTTMSPEQFVSLPGAEKKFGIKYDEVSGKFYALTGLVLPTDAGGVHSSEPELIRSTGSLFSSKDLVNWDLEQIMLYTRNKDTAADSTGWGEGFSYFNFAIDGNDLAVVSRTAVDVGDGQNQPPRAHDTNLMTFHVVDNFRTAKARFVLVADPKANRVMRFEYANTNHLAPIGQFNLGATYDGAALDTPMGVAQTANGDVYVTEDRDGGRVLRFDSAGNYLETVATSGTEFTGNPHQITVGPDGNLYMTTTFGSGSDKVYKINTQTGDVSVFIPTNFASGESFDNPRGLTFASDGNLYVADRENNCIRKFNANGNYLGKIAVGQNRPQALFWDATNNRLIFSRETTTGDNDIARVTLGGSVLTLYTDTDVGFCIGAAAIDGQVFWSDYTNGEIYASTNETNKSKTTSVTRDVTGTAQMAMATGPGRDNRSWIKDANGDWSDPYNWFYFTRPDSNDEIATFGTANSATRYAYINAGESFTVKGLRYLSSNSYIVDGDGALVLEVDSGHALIDVQKGNQWVRVDVKLNSDTDLSIASGQRFEFRDNVNLNGKTLSKTGLGTLDFDQALVLNGGTLKTDGLTPIIFSSPTLGQLTLNGDFEFAPDPSLSLTLGAVINLHDGTSNFNGQQFNKIIMPQLANLLGWDLSDFYTSVGFARVMQVLDPEWGGDFSGDWSDIANWANYARPDSNVEIAHFKAVNTTTRYARIADGQTITVKGLNFNSPNRYIVDNMNTSGGAGALDLNAGSGNASINVQQGSHWIRVDTRLLSNTDVSVAGGGDLSFRDVVNLNGKTFSKTGVGKLTIYGTLAMNGGKIVIDGLSPLTFLSGSSSTLNGDLQFTPDAGLSLTAGSSYNLIDGESYMAGQTFNSIILPTAPNASGWDVSSFYSDGKVKLISVTAPAWTKNIGGNWTDAINWQYDCRPDSNLEIATFASAITTASTVMLNSAYSVKGLRFNSTNKYTLAGSGAINLDADTGHAVIDVQAGSHDVQVPIKLYDITDATLAANTSLLLGGNVDLNGQTLNISGSGFLLCNTLQTNGGTINLTDGTLGVGGSGFLSLTAGSAIEGTGTMHGIVINSGRVSPGPATDALWINGGYGQATNGQLDIELTYAGFHDSLLVLGLASLDGKLKLTLLNGFVPTAGASFTILSAQSLSGTFAAIEGMSVNGNLSLAVTYSATAVKVTAALPGDANLDGQVNLSDLQILGDNWQSSAASWSLADFTGDSNVNLSDLQVLGDNWGGTAADLAAFVATIPEPSCLLLLLGATALVSLRRKAA
ncbi:MAG: hypothetical protein IT445_12685 [Phycisphaeraceae bacterium]|nr:hypothetical protein [Phycisphaeraceae bacterium]